MKNARPGRDALITEGHREAGSLIQSPVARTPARMQPGDSHRSGEHEVRIRILRRDVYGVTVETFNVDYPVDTKKAARRLARAD